MVFRRRHLVYGLPILLASCADSPTSVRGVDSEGPLADVYHLEPVAVDGGSHCTEPTWTRDEHGFCQPPQSGGDPNGTDSTQPSGDDGSGGAPAGDDPTPTPDEAADDELVDCEDLGCELRDPTPSEMERVLDLIDSMRTEGFCSEVRANALTMVNRHLQVWDNRVYAINDDGREAELLGEAPWDYERGGPVMYLWTRSITAWTIAHEAIHGIQKDADYYTHSDITPLGMNLDDTAKYCAGN